MRSSLRESERSLNRSDRIHVEVEVANSFDVRKQEEGLIQPAEVRRLRIPAVVDPSASYLVLPQKVATQLGVPTDGTAMVVKPNRRRVRRPMSRMCGLNCAAGTGLIRPSSSHAARMRWSAGSFLETSISWLTTARKP